MAKIKYHSYLKDYVTTTTTTGQPTSTPLVEGSIVLVLDSSNKVLEHWIWDKGAWKGGALAGGSIGLTIRRVSVSTTLLENDRTVVFTATGLTATLPTPSITINARREYVIKNNSTGTLDITGNIDDVVQTITIGAGDSRTFHGDGITWFLI